MRNFSQNGVENTAKKILRFLGVNEPQDRPEAERF